MPLQLCTSLAVAQDVTPHFPVEATAQRGSVSQACVDEYAHVFGKHPPAVRVTLPTAAAFDNDATAYSHKKPSAEPAFASAADHFPFASIRANNLLPAVTLVGCDAAQLAYIPSGTLPRVELPRKKMESSSHSQTSIEGSARIADAPIHAIEPWKAPAMDDCAPADAIFTNRPDAPWKERDLHTDAAVPYVISALATNSTAEAASGTKIGVTWLELSNAKLKVRLVVSELVVANMTDLNAAVVAAMSGRSLAATCKIPCVLSNVPAKFGLPEVRKVSVSPALNPDVIATVKPDVAATVAVTVEKTACGVAYDENVLDDDALETQDVSAAQLAASEYVH